MTFNSNERLLTPGPLHITSSGPLSNAGLLQRWVAGSVAMANQNWPANNRAIYIPIVVPFRFTVARFFINNGTNATGNVDVGLYAEGGTLLISTGTQTRTGTTVVQYYDVTNQPFPPGHYYMGMVCSLSTSSFGTIQAGSQYEARAAGCLEEALGSTVLPGTMTPASYTSINMFCFGFTQSDTL